MNSSKSLFRLAILAPLLMATLSACQKSSNSVDLAQPTDVNTGDSQIETQVSGLKSSEIQTGNKLYVFSDRVRARSTAEVNPNNIVGVLDLGDTVEVMDPSALTTNQFVQVRVLETKGSIAKGSVVFIGLSFLDKSPPKLSGDRASAARFFVVTNVATEKVRIYQRCAEGEGCVNRMVLQTDVVAGEDDDGTRSILGNMRIASWVKFYEDGKRQYPAWFKPSYPPVPGPDDSQSAWLSSSVMPGGQGAARGAFGWYTATMAPNADGQWMHGTYGWGKNKQEFIHFKDGFWGKVVNLFHSIRSHGCTRVDNEGIAFIRHMLPVGTPSIKIYAREGLRDASRSGYSKGKKSWSYILTKVGFGSTRNQGADRNEVLAAGTPKSQWIEEGNYLVNAYPSATPFNPSSGNSENGNLYDISPNEFRGTFLVDEGTTIGYQHPASLRVGGYSDQFLPSFMVSHNSSISKASAAVEEETDTPVRRPNSMPWEENN